MFVMLVLNEYKKVFFSTGKIGGYMLMYRIDLNGVLLPVKIKIIT